MNDFFPIIVKWIGQLLAMLLSWSFHPAHIIGKTDLSHWWWAFKKFVKLEQLEHLRSEDTPRCLMITHTIESCWIPSQNKVEWPWRYRSRSKVITCNTPSHASYDLHQIWKDSIQNYRRYRADMIFKVKAEWPWKYRSRSKVITCDTPFDANDDLCQIWKEYKQNCRFFFQGESRKMRKICERLKFKNFVINLTCDTPSNSSDYLR